LTLLHLVLFFTKLIDISTEYIQGELMSEKGKAKKIDIKEKKSEADEDTSRPDGTDNVETDTEKSIQDLEDKIESLEQSAKDSYDKFLRISAEFENYKKRSVREMEDFRKYANETLLKEFLSIVDNLERAVQSASTENHSNNPIVQGVDLTLQEIFKIFERFGVSAIESMGKPFDPAFHQAVQQEETEEQPDNVVLRELQKGYMIRERLLRPAMVVVSKVKEIQVAEENNE
jgi:molecular chaperone GrpE